MERLPRDSMATDLNQGSVGCGVAKAGTLRPVAHCQVSGCAEEASHGLKLREKPLLHGEVCAHHQAAIDAGAGWSWHSDEGRTVIHVGDQALPRLISWETEDGGGADQPDRGLILALRVGRSDKITDTIRVWLSQDDATRLGEQLAETGKQ